MGKPLTPRVEVLEQNTQLVRQAIINLTRAVDADGATMDNYAETLENLITRLAVLEAQVNHREPLIDRLMTPVFLAVYVAGYLWEEVYERVAR